MANLPAGSDYRVSIVNAPGAGAYPISAFTYLLVNQEQTDPEKGRKLVDFLRWALSEGQQRAAALDYAPLPKSVADALLARVDEIKVAGAAPAAS